MEHKRSPLSEAEEKHSHANTDYDSIRDACIELVSVVYGNAMQLFPQDKEKAVYIFNSVLLSTLHLLEDSFVLDLNGNSMATVAELLSQKREN